jgi:ABC-type multidrug transport system ATPase subunit
VVCAGVTKRYGNRAALCEFSAVIPAGQTVVLWGANGAGKTTLLRCLLGVVPFAGRIEICGEPAGREAWRTRRLIGYVPQEASLPGEQSAGEALAFFAGLRRLRIDAAAALAAWGLDAAAGAPVRTLSGGMKQRLAVAIALLGDPPVLLMDEPTSHLDARIRRDVLDTLERMRAAGKTLVVCTHRASEVLHLADRVLLLEEGRLAADGPPAQLRGRLGAGRRLGLAVPAALHQRAGAVLAAAGFSVVSNHGYLWVDAQPSRVGIVVQRLLAADIPVEDLDVLEPSAGEEA